MPGLLSTAVAFFGGGSIAGLSVFGVALTTSTGAFTLAGTALSLGGSLLLSTAAAALNAPKQAAVLRELATLTELPPYRHVMGQWRAPASPIATPVLGRYIYAAYLLNSRPSEGEFKFFIDKRAALYTGDLYDFTMSGGAVATEYPFENHAKFWVGLGDQTTVPAQILAEAPWVAEDAEKLFKASDVGKGLTILWARFRNGASEDRADRWRAVPPQIEVEGKFSKVWDFNDPAQDPDDPATWTWSNNHARVLLDAYRTNPFRPYELRNLEMPMWEEAAVIADEVLTKKDGSTVKRYCADGILVFNDTEIEDLVAPIWAAGAARPTRVAGKLGIIPGVWEEPVYTLTDFIDEIEFKKQTASEPPPTRLHCRYTSAARGYEMAELQPWDIPGAQAEDGGRLTVESLDLDWIKEPTQAMRVRNIEGRRRRAQKGIATVAPPSAYVCIAGSTVDVDLAGSFGRFNGTFMVSMIDPTFDVVGESGVALRCPMELREETAAIYAYDAATDEEDVVNPEYEDGPDILEPPGAITVASGSEFDLNSGAAFFPRFKFTFSPSDSETVDGYEWESRVGDEEYRGGLRIGVDTQNVDGNYDFFLNVADVLQPHAVRVRSFDSFGQSEWVELTGVIYDFELTGVTGTAQPGAATFTGNTSGSTMFQGVRVFRTAVGAAFDTGVLVKGLEPFDRDAAFSITAGTPGTDEITNGDFDTAAGWTFGGNWSHDTDKATHTGSTLSILEQALTLDAGADYRLSWTLSNSTSLFRARIEGDTNADDLESGDGLKTAILTAPANTTKFLIRTADPGSVDNISLVKDTGDMLTLGEADYWVVPVTLTGTNGQPSGPITLTIP